MLPLVLDDTDRPSLINAKYIDDADGMTKIEPDVYNAPGKSYHGQARPVFLVVQNNQTGFDHWLSASAFQRALEAAAHLSHPPKWNLFMEFKQIVTQDDKGREVVEVILG